MNYEVVDGAIQCRPKKGGTIYTTDEYSDFMARLEFKLPPGGNNGLAIRYPGQGDTAYDGMCELQVLDDNYEKATGEKIDPRQAHGSAYGMVAAARGYQHPIGEWNFEEVTVKGSKIKVELNGTVILDCDLSTVTEFMANQPASRQGPHQRLLRLRRAQRPGRLPQHPDQAAVTSAGFDRGRFRLGSHPPEH